jgi:putative transposase
LARQARLVVPEYPHHVTQRGGRGQQTFFRQSDFEMYIELLSHARELARVDIWAYCLMPNHVHLIVVPTSGNGLSRLLRNTHSEYARRINKREGWQGHLWQERFHSFVMDENHTIAAARYIEKNPVRAGLCNAAIDWPWSSARAHVAGAADRLVDQSLLTGLIDDWARYLNEDITEQQLHDMRSHSRSGLPLGGARFIRKLENEVGRKLVRLRPGPKQN